MLSSSLLSMGALLIGIYLLWLLFRSATPRQDEHRDNAVGGDPNPSEPRENEDRSNGTLLAGLGAIALGLLMQNTDESDNDGASSSMVDDDMGE